MKNKERLRNYLQRKTDADFPERQYVIADSGCFFHSKDEFKRFVNADD